MLFFFLRKKKKRLCTYETTSLENFSKFCNFFFLKENLSNHNIVFYCIITDFLT